MTTSTALCRFAVATVLAVLLHQCAADCKYRLNVQASDSVFKFSGTSTLFTSANTAVGAKILDSGSSGPLGFQGSLYLLVNGVDTCLNTTQSLLAVASKWQLSSFCALREPGLMHTYPEAINATVAGFPFVVTGLAFNMSTTRLAAIGKTVVAALDSEIAQGYVYTENPTTGTHLDSLTGYKNSSTVTVNAAISVIHPILC
jgi:hypothetical protein